MNQTSQPPNPALGFGMQGMGADVARIVLSICEQFDYVTYLEIGVGHGQTLSAIAALLRDDGVSWRACGVDLPDGYSFNINAVSDQMNEKDVPFFLEMEGVAPRWDMVTLYRADSQVFLRMVWDEPIQLALIDGCHGKPCATNDFLNIEPLVVEGGIVLFHDFGQDQVGQPQPHCPTGLDVRGACRDLGLLNNKRERWHFNETIIGDKRAGSGDMGVFQKQ